MAVCDRIERDKDTKREREGEIEVSFISLKIM
jgi:hypothetical protein